MKRDGNLRTEEKTTGNAVAFGKREEENQDQKHPHLTTVSTDHIPRPGVEKPEGKFSGLSEWEVWLPVTENAEEEVLPGW